MSDWEAVSFEKEVGRYSLRSCRMTSGVWVWRIFDRAKRDSAAPVGSGDAATKEQTFAKAEACVANLQK